MSRRLCEAICDQDARIDYATTTVEIDNRLVEILTWIFAWISVT